MVEVGKDRKPHEIGLRRPAAWRSRQFQVRESREIAHQAAETRVANRETPALPPPGTGSGHIWYTQIPVKRGRFRNDRGFGWPRYPEQETADLWQESFNQLLRVFWMPSLPFLYLPPKGGGGACSPAG